MCSINNEHIQQKLFSEATLTYETALTMALGAETAAKNLKEMKYKDGTGE